MEKPVPQSQTKSDKRPHPEAGVTLVEMMVVILIIGLITAIVAINVLPSQDKARVEKAKADIAAIDQALTLFHLEAARFPTTEEGLEALVTPFIRTLPNDPWNRPYQYIAPGEKSPYDLYSMGADGKIGGEGLDADVVNAR